MHTPACINSWTRDKLVIITLVDVASRVEIVTREHGAPTGTRDPREHQRGDRRSGPFGDEIFLDYSGFDSPSRLLHGAADVSPSEIKSAPSFFDADGLTVVQHFAKSDDGTAVPYFVVETVTWKARSNAAGRLRRVPGLQHTRLRRHPGTALAVPRRHLCHGEYPRWWRVRARLAYPVAACGRHKCFEDFAAVARDLVARGITTEAKLGARGGSNGGLLMG